MTPSAASELGTAIRARRLAQRLTQAELGELAGYGEGANVSISRIESGVTRPNRDSLVGIARALRTTVQEIESDAARIAADSDDGDETPAARQVARESTRKLRDRLQGIIDERVAAVTVAGDAANAAHDRARDEFFLRFVDLARQINDPPVPPGAALPESDGEPDADDQAAFRLKSTSNHIATMLAGGLGGAAAGAAAGGAAAYATFVGVATFGTASTGTAISALSGAAATNATLAALGGGSLAAGGAGVAGGTALLAGIVATPFAILTVGGLLWMVRRNRKQDAELRTKLEQLEADLASSQPGFDAAISAMQRSTKILDTIGTYASRGVEKWSRQVEGIDTWEQLSAAAQERYGAFNTLAACQVAIATIDFTNYMSLRDDALQQFVEVTDATLAQAAEDVDALI